VHAKPDPAMFAHVWWWRSKLPERKGQACRVLVRGRLHSVLVEFEDGTRVVTSRYAIRARPIGVRGDGATDASGE